MKKKQHAYLDNNFFVEVSELHQHHLKNIHKRKGFGYDKNNSDLLTTKEKYLIEVTSLQSRIVGLVEQLYFINTFVRRYPHGKFYKENGINKLNYIKYHTEVLFHKTHTILEVMKLIVNEVYQLNIPVKDCTWKSLIGLINKDTLPLTVIDAYFRSFHKFINYRHLNTHRAIYNDKAMDEIDLYFGFGIREMMDRLGKEIDADFNLRFPEFLMEYNLKEFRKERLRIISGTIDTTNDYLKTFFNSLLPEFRRQINML